MTREEEIVNAAREYTDKAIFASPSNVLHFEAGAKWADEHPVNVWHDASEEPTGTYWRIICQDEEDGCWVENSNDAIRLHNTWNEYVAIELVIKWAYISELLPKGGEL